MKPLPTLGIKLESAASAIVESVDLLIIIALGVEPPNDKPKGKDVGNRQPTYSFGF